MIKILVKKKKEEFSSLSKLKIRLHFTDRHLINCILTTNLCLPYAQHKNLHRIFFFLNFISTFIILSNMYLINNMPNK